MTKSLVISDANILIDMECGDLLKPLFLLGPRIAVPDVLFEVELRGSHPGLPALGLQRMELSPDNVRYVETLASDPRAKGVGRYDLFALALARQEGCLLLTGDRMMRNLAELEGQKVHGTLWLVEQLLAVGRIKRPRAVKAFAAMRRAGRRLPWNEVTRRFGRL